VEEVDSDLLARSAPVGDHCGFASILRSPPTDDDSAH
jgi:hypothetical protein